jgi:hypothetical protein
MDTGQQIALLTGNLEWDILGTLHRAGRLGTPVPHNNPYDAIPRRSLSSRKYVTEEDTLKIEYR